MEPRTGASIIQGLGSGIVGGIQGEWTGSNKDRNGQWGYMGMNTDIVVRGSVCIAH